MTVKASIVSFAPWRRVFREVTWAAVTGIAALVIGASTLGVSLTNIAMRWQTNVADDHTQHYLVAKTITDSPFLGPNLRMGFPTTQNLFFAPNYDPASAIFLWFESLFTSDSVLMLNLYQVIAFFSVGFAAYFLFRALKVRRWIGIVFALIFTLAPYQFQRISFGHVFVANYWAVALLGILILMVAGPHTNPFERWITSGATSGMRRWRRLLPIIVLTLLVSLSLSYYYVFAALILGALLVVRALRTFVERQRLATLLWPAVTVAALALFVVVQFAILSLNFDDRYSKYFGARSPAESEIQAGKITTLLLPWTGTGFRFLAAITHKYIKGSPVSIYAEPPGTPIVASFAMILIVIFILMRLLQSRNVSRKSALNDFLQDERASVIAFAFLWGLLFFVVTGLGVIFAYVVSPEIRSWARMGIVLTMLALAFLATLIDSVLSPLRFALPVVGFLVLIAVVDQLAGVHTTVNLQPTQDTSLRAFVATAENLLPHNCGVVQLPLHSYPATGPVGGMSDYNQALPYILSTRNTLRWSYGAVSGTRSGDYWQKVHTADEFAAAVRSSHACAIEVDRAAYPTPSAVNSWRSLVSTVADIDQPAVTSSDPDHRYLLFTVKAP